MRTRELEDRVVLVTGASTGLGLALVKELRRRHCCVIATARQSSLKRFDNCDLGETDDFLIRPLDINHPGEHEQVIEEIADRFGRLDVLINNAGINFRAVIEDTDDANEFLQFQTNYFGPMQLTRTALPLIRKRHRGHIINISSVGGTMAMPTMGLYSASKFALEGASESLWYELRPWGIYVTLIEPGFIHSDSYRNVRWTRRSREEAEDEDAPYHSYYENMGPFIERMMKLAMSTPEDIARRIVNITCRSHPPLRAPVTPDAWLFGILRRLMPSGLYHRMLYYGLPHIRDWEWHAEHYDDVNEETAGSSGT